MSKDIPVQLDTSNLSVLPEGWVWATVGQVARIESGQTPKGIKDIKNDGNIPWYKVGDMNAEGNERYMVAAEYHLTKSDIELLKLKIRPRGTIIFPKRGGAIYTNKKRILSKDGSYDLNTMGLVVNSSCSKYFWFWFSSIDLGSLSDGSNVPQINHPDIAPLVFPLPPTNEQCRIVAKIEELFSRLDAGVKALKQVQAQLKQYRQAVLKAAVEGKLTAQWREEHKGELEPASELLQRILRERREKWEGKQIARYEAKGQKPPRDWREKYKEPAQPDTSNLPELPEGWVWGTLSVLCIVQGGFAFKSKDYQEEGIPLLRISNIRGKEVDFSKDVVFLDETYLDLYPDFILEKNDIVIALSGATTGKYGIYELEETAFLNQRVGRIKYHTQSLISTRYIFHYLAIIRDSILTEAYGAAQPNISPRELAEFTIPIPPLTEQYVIAEEIDRLFSIADTTEDGMRQEINRSAYLRQSILKRAFSGKLVRQDSDDEPAEVLLERIKAEKTKRETEEKVKRSRKNSYH